MWHFEKLFGPAENILSSFGHTEGQPWAFCCVPFSNPLEQCAIVEFDLGIAYLARAASAKMRWFFTHDILLLDSNPWSVDCKADVLPKDQPVSLLSFSNLLKQCAMVGFDLGIAYLARAASAKMRWFECQLSQKPM